MSKFWDVEFKANPFYMAVEADTAEEAINKALNWYEEYEPEISCVPHVPDEDDDLYCEVGDEEPCCEDCDYYTSNTNSFDCPCFWCNEYSEFKKKNW